MAEEKIHLRYNGVTKDFKYKGHDFSKGPAEMSKEEAAALIKANPRTFTAVKPAKVAPVKSTKASK